MMLLSRKKLKNIFSNTWAVWNLSRKFNSGLILRHQEFLALQMFSQFSRNFGFYAKIIFEKLL